MLCRGIIVFVLLLALSLPAPATELFPLPDQQVALAAREFRRKNYGEARDSAAKAPQGGIREFLLGISAMRLEEWQAAVDHLARAADSFPLLADHALYNQGRALHRLARFGEALPPLQRLAREFPDSPLFRSAQLLLADTLRESGDFRNAYSAYQKFIEKFPTGADSLSATYNSALCLEQLGEQAGAVTALRNIWLRYPASTFAGKAEKDLQRLAAGGVRVEPYSGEELLRRATTLYDLKRYNEAASALQGLRLEEELPGAAGRRLLKAGQALYLGRRYKEAEAAFAALQAKATSREIADEAGYWLAKALDRSGRDGEAFTTFLRLAESSAASGLADKALFEAALIRKGENRKDEALAILKRLLLSHPSSPLKQSVTWQIAWGSYQTGDWKTAAEYFRPLTEGEATREKALYWYGRTLSAAGDIPGAQGTFSALLAEFPFGFYAQSYRKEVKLDQEEISLPVGDVREILPVPPGFDRVKALITLGLLDEARKELAFSKKKGAAKNGAVSGIARLYLEMDDYNGAYNLLRNERPRSFEKDTIYQWGLSFPLGYRDHVAQTAAAHDLPESLVYSIIRAESSFLPTALSPAGAVGLMQLMPATAASMANGARGKFNPDSLTNPETNIRLGARHLRDLLDLYQGDLVLAVAAYNAGSGNVNRWRKAFGGLRPDEFVESIPFAETREYVKKVLTNAEIYSRLYRLGRPAAPEKAATLPEKEETPPPQPAASPQVEPRLIQADSSPRGK
ncbi:MAG: transglycosylase SLT domain-containing protein [Geobacteraceae bacterium]|nr:transglycosylase SLT domain-containing protein [Geobacteraceae bacterium]